MKRHDLIDAIYDVRATGMRELHRDGSLKAQMHRTAFTADTPLTRQVGIPREPFGTYPDLPSTI